MPPDRVNLQRHDENRKRPHKHEPRPTQCAQSLDFTAEKGPPQRLLPDMSAGNGAARAGPEHAGVVQGIAVHRGGGSGEGPGADDPRSGFIGVWPAAQDA